MSTSNHIKDQPLFWPGIVLSLALVSICLSGLAPKFYLPYFEKNLPAGLLFLFSLVALAALKITNLVFKVKTKANITILLLAILAIALGPFFAKPFAFINLPLYTAELSVLVIFGFLIWNHKNWALPLLLLISIISLICLFYSMADERILHSDDHSTFLYRLEMLKENFPYIPFYNPLWNSGIDERYFFATGTLNIFFILAPVIYFVDLWQHYNIVPTFIAYVLLPGTTYIAGKLYGLSNRSAALASFLALSPSLAWFNWALHFGPLGFLTTTCLTPLLAVLSLRALDRRRQLGIFEALILTIIATLVLFWTPGGIIFAPVIILGLFRISILWQKPKLIFVAALLVIINLPWVLVFWSASNVTSFLKKEEGVRKISYEKPAQSGVDHYQQDADNSPTAATLTLSGIKVFFQKGIGLFQKYAHGSNILILFLALPALLSLAPSKRKLFLSMSLWLLILGTVIAPLKPQLELDRMMVVLFIFLAIPVADFIDKRIMLRNNLLARFNFAIITAFIGLYTLANASVLKGRTHIPMNFRSPLADNLVKAIDEFTVSGRSLFAGFILHELDGGHVAPLTLKTRTPLIASSPVHKYWRYTDVTPSEFLKDGPDGFEKYFELVNAETVIAHDRTWREFFMSRPDRYKLVWQERRFSLFKRLNTDSTYFIEGQGQILEQSSSYVKLKLQSKNALIKFNYFPFLESSACNLTPTQVADEIYFINLQECPTDQEIIIKSKPAHARIQL